MRPTWVYIRDGLRFLISRGRRPAPRVRPVFKVRVQEIGDGPYDITADPPGRSDDV